MILIKGDIRSLNAYFSLARRRYALILFQTARETRAVRKTKAMQPLPGFRRYCPVLRLLLFLVMLLAPDFSDSDAPATSPEALQPAFDKGGPSRSADREVRS
jgi:hypothetical protein